MTLTGPNCSDCAHYRVTNEKRYPIRCAVAGRAGLHSMPASALRAWSAFCGPKAAWFEKAIRATETSGDGRNEASGSYPSADTQRASTGLPIEPEGL